jgi:hypothetical protein
MLYQKYTLELNDVVSGTLPVLLCRLGFGGKAAENSPPKVPFSATFSPILTTTGT